MAWMCFTVVFQTIWLKKLLTKGSTSKKTELVQLKEKTEFFDLRGKNFFNKLIFDQQLAVEIFSTRGKKGNIF